MQLFDCFLSGIRYTGKLVYNIYIYIYIVYIIYIYTYIHTYIPYHTIPYHTITLHYITLHYITLHYIHTYPMFRHAPIICLQQAQRDEPPTDGGSLRQSSHHGTVSGCFWGSTKNASAMEKHPMQLIGYLF